MKTFHCSIEQHLNKIKHVLLTITKRYIMYKSDKTALLTSAYNIDLNILLFNSTKGVGMMKFFETNMVSSTLSQQARGSLIRL